MFWEVEATTAHRDWLRRLATTTDPRLSAHFREEAERLTTELDHIKREKTDVHG